jgi:hypothetical protein
MHEQHLNRLGEALADLNELKRARLPGGTPFNRVVLPRQGLLFLKRIGSSLGLPASRSTRAGLPGPLLPSGAPLSL